PGNGFVRRSREIINTAFGRFGFYQPFRHQVTCPEVVVRGHHCNQKKPPTGGKATCRSSVWRARSAPLLRGLAGGAGGRSGLAVRSEEHTSELQSRENLVCRLLLE